MSGSGSARNGVRASSGRAGPRHGENENDYENENEKGDEGA
jgi:hypothetical protein